MGGENGWTIIPHAPAGLFKTKIADKSERDKNSFTIFEKKMIWKICFANLQGMRLNHKDLNEAIYCYNNKCYKACAMILCSMIDGMIYKRQPVKRTVGEKGDSKFLKNKRKWIKGRSFTTKRFFLTSNE